MIMPNHNSTNVENVSDFQKALECPVCLEVVKKPFKLCSRGHLVCVCCLNNLTTCPTCKGELLLENPVCIQHLLECLPRSCRYSGDGCEVMVQDGNDHEKFCGFRRIKCRMAICKQYILAKDLSEHVNTVHADVFVIKTDKPKSVTLPGYKSDETYGGLYVFFFKHVCCISVDNNDDEQVKITFESFPVGKVDGDYYAKVTFTKEAGDIGYMYTLKASPVEENEHESEQAGDKTENNRAEIFCMKVPKSMLSNFINKNGCLVYNVFVFKG